MLSKATPYFASRAATAVASTAASREHEEGHRHWDRLLDEALKDTFPASDPPSIATPH